MIEEPMSAFGQTGYWSRQDIKAAFDPTRTSALVDQCTAAPRFRTIQVRPMDLPACLVAAFDAAVIPEGGTSHVRHGTAGVRGAAWRRRGGMAACGAGAAAGDAGRRFSQ